MPVNTQNRAAIYTNRNGKFNGQFQIGIGKSGGQDSEVPGATKTLTYGVNSDFSPTPVVEVFNAPSAQTQKVVEYYDEDTENFFLTAKETSQPVTVQERIHRFITLDNPRGWTQIRNFYGGNVDSATLGAAATRDYSGEGIVNSATVTFNGSFVFRRPTVTSASLPTIVAGVTDALMIDRNVIIPGFPGTNKICLAVTNAPAAEFAQVLVSSDGGYTWAATLTDPFSADESISAVTYQIINETQIRVIVGNGTAGAGSAQIAWSDLYFNDLTDSSWTVVTNSGGTVGDTVQALAWGIGWVQELIIVSAGDVYAESSQGESWTSTAVYTGTDEVLAVGFSPDSPLVEQAIYFVGENNLLLRKTFGKPVTTLVGASAGNNLTSVAFSKDGTLFVSDDNDEVFRSVDRGLTSGGWYSLTSSFSDTVGINTIGGDSEFLMLVNAGTFAVSPDAVIFENITIPGSPTLAGGAFSQSNVNTGIIYGIDTNAYIAVY